MTEHGITLGTTAIVVEGGAMRGIFAAGVLDELLARNLSDFDIAVGTSAGACNLASFVAQQYGRNPHCYMNIMTRPELFSTRRYLRGGHFMDLDWLWERFATEAPLDETALQRSRTRLFSVATCFRSGRALYHAQREQVHENVKGGCALPLLYRGPVDCQGSPVVDGGVADSIPVRWAYQQGARRIVVVRSRPADAVKQPGPTEALASWLCRDQPQLARAIRHSRMQYLSAVRFLSAPPADLKLIQIAPTAPLATARTSQKLSTLREDYGRGRSLAAAAASRIEALFAAPLDQRMVGAHEAPR